MNFKFTAKRAAIFIIGLIVAAAASTALDNQMLGLLIVVAVVWYIAKET